MQNFGGKTGNEYITLECLGVDGKVILKYISEKWDVRVWTGCK
jgi:hypothetical protein